MKQYLRGVFLVCIVFLALFTHPISANCVIDLKCRECVPDNMPVVTSHRAVNGSVSVSHGDEVTLSCYGGKFLLFPLRDSLTAVCHAGKYHVRGDRPRHILELGCQESVFEDVLHEVQFCGAPLQGRAYQMHETGRKRHLATVCFDSDRGLATFARASNFLTLPSHADRSAPLSLLGNFHQMFDSKTRSDAEHLYSDNIRLNRRLHELLKHEHPTFAGQTLTSAKLLCCRYFNDQYSAVTDFVSNKIAAWHSVASGNLKHLFHDVSAYMKAAVPRVIDVYAGTHEVMTIRSGSSKTEVYLKGGRFPVPKYVWTVVHDISAAKAVALVILNDPFVAVSEIRDSVFCDSMCSSVTWLHELLRNRNYEVPIYGLAFCCDIHSLSKRIAEVPKGVFGNIPSGSEGVLFT